MTFLIEYKGFCTDLKGEGYSKKALFYCAFFLFVYNYYKAYGGYDYAEMLNASFYFIFITG